ncbi:MAG: hypothetical protein LBU73_03290 [Helicobacteraceae bacterium]|jgi:hypothetical protein|nr:hypothetical protein [Helicobacteraceae bacterium]
MKDKNEEKENLKMNTEATEGQTQSNGAAHFDFFKPTMPKSREANFYLGCRDGSVYLDFNYTIDKRINLRRISFDGYGCCDIDANAKCLDYQLSKDFIEEIDKDNLDQEKIKKIVLELIRLNKDSIWTDALEEYNLIDN